MNSYEYWKQREEEQRKHSVTDEVEYKKRIEEIHNYMMDQIQKEINGFYARYAKKEGITIAEAKKRVAKLDIEAYERKAKKYVKEKDFSDEANDEMRLYNLTMKVNRLEMLKANIGLELVDGYNDLQKYFEQVLTEQTLEEFKRQAGILGKTVLNNEKMAHSIVNASFHNAKYSDRIWMYQDMLKTELDKLLRQGLIQGRNPQVLARHLTKLFGVSKYNAETLMITELARVQVDARFQEMMANGYTQYVYIACGNSDVCDACKALDGKVFYIKDAEIGGNAPPMHPRCHCSVAAHMDDKEFEEWLEGQGEEDIYALSESTNKWAKEAKEELLKSEKSLGNREIETMEVYGPDGKYIMTKRGESDNVRLSVLDYPKLKNAVVTHNHPSGGSFSFKDIRFLKNMPISELRVSTSDCVYYIRKPKQWPEAIKTSEQLEKAIKNIRKELRPKYEQLYNKGKITKIQRYRMFSAEVNRIFAERYGLEYGRETYE